MSWQLIIVILILVGAVVAINMRRVALSTKDVFFGICTLSFLAIAISGTLISIINNHGLPAFPTGKAQIYIILEGILIPTAWLFQYKLISFIGASNAVIVGSVNTIGVALMGIIFLSEKLSLAFVCGAALVISSIYMALRIQPDTKHHVRASFKTKIILAFGVFLFYSLGLFYEKLAINSIGVWNYSGFGWGMQFLGSLIIFLLFGRHELKHINRRVVRNGLLLGFMTCMSGGLYIYALSKGTLSHTIIASSGKVAVTMMLSALLLKERNQLKRRFASLAFSIAGICLVLF